MTFDVVQATRAAPAAPEAGRPRFRSFLLRRVLFPIYCRCTSWERAAEVFQAEGQIVMALVRRLGPSAFQESVRTKPVWGMEDSACGWSAEMVLEHLIEVGARIAIVVVELSHGEKPSVRTEITEGKPKGGRGAALIEDYLAFLEDYAQTLSDDVGDRRSRRTHPHPWLGELTAHQWACLGAVHQALHRRQIERILAGLPTGERGSLAR
jgi:hypothetical protein